MKTIILTVTKHIHVHSKCSINSASAYPLVGVWGHRASFIMNEDMMFLPKERQTIYLLNNMLSRIFK